MTLFLIRAVRIRRFKPVPMLTRGQRAAVRRSWELVVPIADTAADLFYKRLFELNPSYRTMFGDDLAPQRRKLIAMLRFIVKSVDWPDTAWRENVPAEQDLFLVVLALGRRHTDLYRVPDEAYATVGEALLWTLDYGLGEAFTAEVKEAWVQIYT
ncbi:MAG TPA: globin domain-containing protein, partial [Kofleriaceae bacterium]|nr:globin domain-containing protein [Kofleriaceae bacterium]